MREEAHNGARAADTSGHPVAAKVRTAGKFVLDVLYGLDAAAHERLAR